MGAYASRVRVLFLGSCGRTSTPPEGIDVGAGLFGVTLDGDTSIATR